METKKETVTVNEKPIELKDMDMERVSGGASLTSKAPKYSVGTWVFFIRKTGDKDFGIVDDITIIPDQYLDQYRDQYPDGFFYTIRDTSGRLSSWFLELVTEDRITGIYPSVPSAW